MTRNRLLVVLLSVLFVAACASSGQRELSSADTGSTDTTSSLQGGAIDCGTFDLASGWPTTVAPPQSMIECLDEAFRTGTPARLVLSAQTDGEGGAPMTTTYLVTGQGIVHVTIDATRAADRPQVVSTKDCRSLDPSGPEPMVANCENMAN